MSKKYFLKYIQVEGEIKEGDYYLDEGLVVKAHLDEQVYANPHVNYFDGYKKVKLFLCSRDIQVGDTIQNEKGDIGILKGKGNGNIWFDIGESHGLYSGEKYWFKVIGEVSPDALAYVKDGDEFDEDEVGMLYNFVGEDSDDEFFTIEEFWKEAKRWYKGKIPSYIDPPIAIKGPCGHFH